MKTLPRNAEGHPNSRLRGNSDGPTIGPPANHIKLVVIGHDHSLKGLLVTDFTMSAS